MREMNMNQAVHFKDFGLLSILVMTAGLCLGWYRHIAFLLL